MSTEQDLKHLLARRESLAGEIQAQHRRVLLAQDMLRESLEARARAEGGLAEVNLLLSPAVQEGAAPPAR